MQLSEHFSLEEATLSQTAARKRIDNMPSPLVLDTMYHTAQRMEEVRTLLGDHRIHVSSWYRSGMLNSAIGGAPTSQHTKGEAVDFTCSAYGPPRAVYEAIKASNLPYDQLILEYGRWVHISFTQRRAPRRQAFEMK